VILPCPKCIDGNPHILTIRRIGDEFVVQANDDPARPPP
jgi:hypothetical protein